jgi:hypothetical protein
MAANPSSKGSAFRGRFKLLSGPLVWFVMVCGVVIICSLVYRYASTTPRFSWLTRLSKGDFARNPQLVGTVTGLGVWGIVLVLLAGFVVLGILWPFTKGFAAFCSAFFGGMAKDLLGVVLKKGK